MKIKTNYHTHCYLCNHAEGLPIDYVKEAINLGMEEIGFSDHGHILESALTKEEYEFVWLKHNMTLEQFNNIYLPNIDLAIKQYSNKIKIYKGLEIEYIDSLNSYYEEILKKLDYLILGIHYFRSGVELINSHLNISYSNVIDYALTASKALDTGYFKILAHPDFFMAHFTDRNNERNWTPECDIASRIIIESAIRNNVYLEVNYNGIHNSGFKKTNGEYLYPYSKFWEIVKTYKDAKIIAGLDAHSLDALSNQAVTLGNEFISDLGLNILERVKFD